MYCSVLYCIVLYCMAWHCIALHCICIVLYCIVLYCIVLYCIVLYCIVFINITAVWKTIYLYVKDGSIYMYRLKQDKSIVSGFRTWLLRAGSAQTQLLKASSDVDVTAETDREFQRRIVEGKKEFLLVLGIGSHGLWLLCRNVSDTFQQECWLGCWRFGTS